MEKKTTKTWQKEWQKQAKDILKENESEMNEKKDESESESENESKESGHSNTHNDNDNDNESESWQREYGLIVTMNDLKTRNIFAKNIIKLLILLFPYVESYLTPDICYKMDLIVQLYLNLFDPMWLHYPHHLKPFHSTNPDARRILRYKGDKPYWKDYFSDSSFVFLLLSLFSFQFLNFFLKFCLKISHF